MNLENIKLIQVKFNRVTKIEAAQFHMLLAMYETTAANMVAKAQFLASISASCRAQKAADQEYHVPWSRHLLASLLGGQAVSFLLARVLLHITAISHTLSPHTHLMSA